METTAVKPQEKIIKRAYLIRGEEKKYMGSLNWGPPHYLYFAVIRCMFYPRVMVMPRFPTLIVRGKGSTGRVS